MNDTLKAAGRIGAELGAAKAENERLRGLLREFCERVERGEVRSKSTYAKFRDALSQKAEPTDTYTAVDMATAAAQGFRDGQAAVEPAAAQDEAELSAEEILMLFERNGFHIEAGASYSAKGQIAQLLNAAGELLRRNDTRPAQTAPQGKFRMGDRVKKTSGSEWVGRVVGTYSTEQTKEGYAVESSAHRNSVQIYPAKALEAVE